MTRQATLEEASSIAAVGLTVWISTYCLDGVPPLYAGYVLEQFNEARIRTQMESPDSRFYVASHDGGIVGFVELRLRERHDGLVEENQAEIERLYVLERFKHRGLGRRLLELACGEAFSLGAQVAWLRVYSGNEAALSFYRRLGWRHVGDSQFVLGAESHLNHVYAKWSRSV